MMSNTNKTFSHTVEIFFVRNILKEHIFLDSKKKGYHIEPEERLKKKPCFHSLDSCPPLLHLMKNYRVLLKRFVQTVFIGYVRKL